MHKEVIESMIMTLQKVCMNKNSRYQFYKIMIPQLLYFGTSKIILEQVQGIDTLYDNAFKDQFLKEDEHG